MTTGKILGNTYILNGRPADVSGFQPDLSIDVYYEVVRLIDRKVLFLDDHLVRFRSSLFGSGLDYPGDSIIIENLRSLLMNNNSTEGNVRLCLQKNESGKTDLLCYFVAHYYPETCSYLSGVQLVSYPYERPNPGIKKWDNMFRTSVAEIIRDYGVYEVLLINARGEITEGSRSNVFFIDEMDRLISPPKKDILPGITRKYVLQICAEEGIEVIERPVDRSELERLVSCFITGTSPKVLPVWQLDGYPFKVDQAVLKKIMKQFDALLQGKLKTIV